MHHSFCQNLTRLLLMLSDWMNNSWDTVTWQSCFVVIGSLLFWIKLPLLTHLRDSNVVQFQQSLFTAKVSYYTVTGYTTTTIFDRVTEACDEKRIKKTETAKQSTTWQAKQLGSTYMGGDQWITFFPLLCKSELVVTWASLSTLC